MLRHSIPIVTLAVAAVRKLASYYGQRFRLATCNMVENQHLHVLLEFLTDVKSYIYIRTRYTLTINSAVIARKWKTFNIHASYNTHNNVRIFYSLAPRLYC